MLCQTLNAESEEVMKHHHLHYEHTCHHKPVGVMRHHDTDSKCHCKGRERRQIRRNALRDLRNEALA